MSDFTVTVVGTGVIGASLGLAIKQTKDPPRLVAHDKELSNAKAAVQQGAFDKAEWNLINACEQAEIIILALPLNGIRATLEAITPYLKKGAIISDTARSKAPVVAWAEELLPKHAQFVGGDPVVYPHGSGHSHAAPTLFKNRLYCLTPSASADEEAVQFMVGLVKLIGGEPFFVDAVEHDGLITATEHLSLSLSAALMNTLATQPGWRETRKLAGALFEQASAGAEGDPDDLKDSLLNNRQNLGRWLDTYLNELMQLRRLLLEADETGEALAQYLDKAVVARRNWLADYQQGRFIDPELVQPTVETTSFWKRWVGFGR